MSGWGNRTPEQRAAQAERMRQLNRDPEWIAKRGKGTPEQRAASSERMKRQNADPAFNAKKNAHQKDPVRQGELRQRGERLRQACDSDIHVRSSWLAGVHQANRKPARRKRSAAVLAENKSKPGAQDRAVQAHKALGRSEMAKKGWITRRRNRLAARAKAAAKPENRREL